MELLVYRLSGATDLDLAVLEDQLPDGAIERARRPAGDGHNNLVDLTTVVQIAAPFVSALAAWLATRDITVEREKVGKDGERRSWKVHLGAGGRDPKSTERALLEDE